MRAFTPFDPEEFYEGNIVDKTVAVVIAPVYLGLKFTCPVLHDNFSISWNKPLAIIHAATIPWLWYVLLRQYEQPDFGGFFPRYACAIIGSGVLVPLVALSSELKNPPFYYRFLVYITFFNCILWARSIL